MTNGWIKLHRQLLEWEWYTETNTLALFIHLLLTSNRQPTKWRGVSLEAGETIKSLETLADETGLSVRNIRTAVKHMEVTGEVTQRRHNKYRILKLKNYCQYQLGDTETDTQVTADREVKKKEVKKSKKEKTIKQLATVSLTDDELTKLYSRYSKGAVDKVIGEMNDWLPNSKRKYTGYDSYPAAIRSWLRKDGIEESTQPMVSFDWSTIPMGDRANHAIKNKELLPSLRDTHPSAYKMALDIMEIQQSFK